MLLRRALAVVLALVCLGAPGLASAEVTDTATSDPKAGLPADATERREVLEERIAQADAEGHELHAQVEASDRRRQELDGVIAGLDGQLDSLNSQLVAIRGDLDQTTFAYVSAERGIDTAAEHLSQARNQVARRATEVYKQGPAGMVNFVLDAQDLDEVAVRATYVKAIVHADRARLDDLRAAQDDYENRSVAIDDLKVAQKATFDRVVAVQHEIEANRASHDRARADAAAETENKRNLLAKVEANRAVWQAMIARELQDSLGITELLALYQGGQNIPPGVIAGMLSFPVIGSITSVFGYRIHPIYGTTRLHAGLDISANTGEPIRAPADGTIVTAGWLGGYGNTVVIDHGSRIATLHGHQSVLNVAPGQVVKAGDVIGLVGSTGLSTGPHLHFEVRVNGEPTDPAPWMRAP